MNIPDEKFCNDFCKIKAEHSEILNYLTEILTENRLKGFNSVDKGYRILNKR